MAFVAFAALIVAAVASYLAIDAHIRLSEFRQEVHRLAAHIGREVGSLEIAVTGLRRGKR